jgi:transcriptional regulator with XRE-family HTH domain
MTGPEMKAWREAAGLTLNEAAFMLHGDVTQPTLSRWEQSEKAIPQWACDIFLGATKITLSVDELHALLDYARKNDRSFNEVLAEAIRSWLSRQNTKNIRTPLALGTVVATADQLMDRVAEPETAYPEPRAKKRDNAIAQTPPDSGTKNHG